MERETVREREGEWQRVERGRVCIWKGWSVRALGEGECVYM